MPSLDDEEKALRHALGRALREARKAAGITAQALATRMGHNTAASTVTRWETGKRPINADCLARFARETGQPIDKLLARTLELLAEGDAKRRSPRGASPRSKQHPRRRPSH